MTSHQFSVNKNAVGFDFKISLKSIIAPAVMTFASSLVLFVLIPFNLFVIYSENGKFNFENIRNFYAIALTNMSDGRYEGIYYMFLGVLFAVCAFGFISKKKAVNVFFSLSVNRSTLYKNRILSSILMIVTAIGLPILADVAMNIFFLNDSLYIIECAFWLFMQCFVCCFFGFAITATAMTACTTLIESVLFSGALIAAPSVLVYFVDSVCSAFLNGYNRDDLFSYQSYAFSQSSLFHETSIVNPLLMSKAYGADRLIGDSIFNFVCRRVKAAALADDSFALEYSYSIENYGRVKLGIDYIIPIIVWLAVSVCLVVLAKRLFVKIKAENAGAHGTNAFASGFFASVFAIGMFSLWIDSVYYLDSSFDSIMNIIVGVALGIAIMIAVYLTVIVVCKRTIKIKLKNLTTPACLTVCAIVAAVVSLSGGLGYSTYVPEVDKIEKAIISSSVTDCTFNEFTNILPVKDNYAQDIFTAYSSYQAGIGVFTDKEDLELLTQLNKKLTEQTDNMTGNVVCVYYQLKSGRIVSRRYNVTDYDAAYSILSLRDSKAGREELTSLFTGGENDTPIADKLDGTLVSVSNMFYAAENEVDAGYVIRGGRVYAIGADGIVNGNTIKNTPELRQALLTDMLAQTYEQRYKPTERAIGGVYFSSYDLTRDGVNFDSDLTAELGINAANSSCEAGYYIYPSMTNTVNYLKSTGEYDLLRSPDDKITSVSIEKCKSVRAEQFAYLGDYSEVSYIFSALNQANYVEYEGTEDYYISYKYNIADYFTNSKSITDSETISELVNKSRSYYFADDYDYFILVNYENAGSAVFLLPANEVKALG